MLTKFRALLVLLGLGLSSEAAVIQIPVQITGSTGSYQASLPVGTPLSVSANLITAGPDLVEDPTEGFFSVTSGSFSLLANNIPIFSFVVGSVPVAPAEAGFMSVRVINSTEGNDEITVYAENEIGDFSVFARLTGESNLVNTDAFPTEGSINWAALLSVYGEGALISNIVPTFEGVVPDNGFSYALVAVPEPGTMFGVAAGGLVLFLRRRQSR